MTKKTDINPEQLEADIVASINPQQLEADIAASINPQQLEAEIAASINPQQHGKRYGSLITLLEELAVEMLLTYGEHTGTPADIIAVLKKQPYQPRSPRPFYEVQTLNGHAVIYEVDEQRRAETIMTERSLSQK